MNYDLKMEEIIKNIDEGSSLLLHACCAPCSSTVLERLGNFFKISILYYNPNIFPPEEYEKRLLNQKKVVEKTGWATLMPSKYDHGEFLTAVKGLETEPEGGARCTECFKIRLLKTAKAARDGGFDYFATTWSVSPHKNAALLGELGEKIGEEYGVKHLPSDFKKREGYKRSIELSKELDLYRQDYCGCEFSKRG